MTSMIEKVAAAMLKELISSGEYIKDLGDGLIKIDGCIDLGNIASVAIEALREPTPEMIAAGAWSNYGWTREQSIERGKEAVYDEYASNAASIYREIIEAALKEQEKVG